MSKKTFNRRDFLKLAGITPFLLLDFPPSKNIQAGATLAGFDDPPNILVLVFDALSARNMSLYGYPRHTTPNIERFASQATVFHRHYAGGNFTTPGTASLLTGSYPWSHRAINVRGSVSNQYLQENLFTQHNTIYNTFSYTHNPLVFILLHQFRDSIFHLTPISELCLKSTSLDDQLFLKDYSIALEGEILLFKNRAYPSASMFYSFLDDLKRTLFEDHFNKEYRYQFPRGLPKFSLDARPSYLFFLLENAVDWLMTQLVSLKKPYFGYVHYLPPHHPYNSRREFIDQFSTGWEPIEKTKHFFSMGFSEEFIGHHRRWYDETIAYVDAEFGRLIEFMQGRGMLDNTILILTSDHGEMFERNIMGHYTPTLFEPIVHIPLLISVPGQRQRRDVYIPTSNVDIGPTLLQTVGMSAPSRCEGRILPTFETGQADPTRSIFTVEAKENPKNKPLQKYTLALIKGPHKLVHYAGYEGYQDEYELFNVEDDPEELNDLYNEADSLSRLMKEELLDKVAEVNKPYEQKE